MPLWNLHKLSREHFGRRYGANGSTAPVRARCRVPFGALGRWLLCCFVFGCSGSGDAPTGQSEARWVALELGGDAPLGELHPVFEPAAAVRRTRIGPDRTLQLEVVRTPFVARVPGYCAVTVSDGQTERYPVAPWFDFPAALAQVGFDSTVHVDVTAGCDSARAGAITWRQVEGQPVSVQTRERGFRLQLRTRSVPSSLASLASVDGQARHGLVPVAAAQQGRVVLEARHLSAGGRASTRRLVITSIARATGLPTVAVGQRVLLNGPGWALSAQPAGSKARIAQAGAFAALTADRRGRYVVQDADGCHLTLQAGRHNEVPFDCGRAPCHAEPSRFAAASPMSHALSGLRIDARGEANGCLPDCHFAGEAGLEDGGFLDTAHALGHRPSDAVAFERLPVALRRLGGVRCTDCHGPAAIPPENDRARILAPSVCATCHDDPPRLELVARWRVGKMARADQLPPTRQPGCAGCHTTAGFLDRMGVRAIDGTDAGRIGIACAACHAAHGPHGARLLRALPPPDSLGPSHEAPANPGPCVHCHAPLPEEALPSASAAAIVVGQVRLPVRLGAEAVIRGAHPHAGMAAGCAGCHGRASTRDSRVDHAFGVGDTLCQDCHAAGLRATAVESQRALSERASRLWQTLGTHCGAFPDDANNDGQHGRQGSTEFTCTDARLARAQYLVALVLRDRAAAVHNPSFAAMLLSQAEGLLD